MRFIHFLIITIFFFNVSCTVTSHPVRKVIINDTANVNDLMGSNKVKLGFEKIIAADIVTNLKGLVDLDNPKAANLEDKLEKIYIYFFVIDHPLKGRYLIDSGIAHSIAKNNKDNPIPWHIKMALKMDKANVIITTKEFLETSKQIKGLFLTHMHIDHIMGLPDISKDIAIYVGQNETRVKSFKNFLVRGVTDDLLEKFGVISELTFSQERAGIDFFGDGSLIIFWVPGHTAGSLAFLVRAHDGTHLLTGDTCQTAWGWNNSVSPGKFSLDIKKNQTNLEWLINFVKNSKEKIKVHLGHQNLK